MIDSPMVRFLSFSYPHSRPPTSMRFFARSQSLIPSSSRSAAPSGREYPRTGSDGGSADVEGLESETLSSSFCSEVYGKARKVDN